MHVIIYQRLEPNHTLTIQAKVYYTLEAATREAWRLADRGKLIQFSIEHPIEESLTLEELKENPKYD